MSGAVIRSYFWKERVLPSWLGRIPETLGVLPDHFFTTGNAGDIFAEALLRFIYDRPVANCASGGRRILSVGSVFHRAQNGDILCGIGMKEPSKRPIGSPHLSIWGLRGPLSLEAAGRGGWDISNVRFLADPGLLIGEFLDGEESQEIGPPIFIPHYRERSRYRNRTLPMGAAFVTPDADPIKFARRIQGASAVLSSSLHGIIFAHALGRPCVFVRPGTKEPLFKFEDHFAAMGVEFRRPLSDVFSAKPSDIPLSPASIPQPTTLFTWPTLDDLQAAGVACG